MRVAIVGAGAVGSSIARELVAHGHDVTIIDNAPDAIHVAQIPQADWLLADACAPHSLEEAGLHDCDVLVAATGEDRVNLVVSLLAKTEFAVPKVVARVNDPANEWMFDSTWGVDVPTSVPRVMAALVEEAVSPGHAVRLFTLNDGKTNLYAFSVPEDSPLVGVDPSEHPWPEGLVVVALVRDGQPHHFETIPELCADDEVVIVANRHDASQLAQLEAQFGAASEDPKSSDSQAMILPENDELHRSDAPSD